MIEEKDLPLLLFLEQKLIDSKNFDAFSFSSNLHSGIKSQSQFNNLARILFKYDIAKPMKGKGNPDIVIISKTDLTDEKRLQYFFDKQTESNIEENIKLENLKLTNNELKHQQTIREQGQRILNLSEENLKLQNRRLKIELLIFVVGLIVGGIFSNLPDILKYVSTHLQQENQQNKLQKGENYHTSKNNEQTLTITSQKDTITKIKNDSTTNK